ncbi:MAG: ATP-binding protein [Verrucomicrobia subdivision 3 bacterium]|nr:ATP-binding protein [Limisphaerales bacterium]
MNTTPGFELIFPREYLRAALMVSLLSVWVLVGLFYYLNRYTRRRYFTVWTAAWLFYALWLTLGITTHNPEPGSFSPIVRQWCVGISAIFLLWGSLHFLEIPVRQTLFGLFMGFLLVWSYVSPRFLDDPLLIQMPIFMMIGIASMFAGLSFYRLRKQRQFVGVGMLFFGFLLWGVYLATYPFSQKYDNLITAGFLVSAVLQLFIAVSMIVLVLEEARYKNEQGQIELVRVRNEKQQLEMQFLTAQEECRSLFHQARNHEELQQAYDALRQTQYSVVQQERLRALGQMASGVAHDINNALSPVLAFAELLLQKEPALSEDSRQKIRHIHTAGEDIAHIVARMGEFYRRREDQKQLRLFEVNRIIHQVIELTSPRWQDIALGQGLVITVQADIEPDLPRLYGNESDLREALTNLLLNAVDALPSGGAITVSSRSVAPRAASDNPSRCTHIAIEVRDNGIGMDEATRHRCLEPFFSTKRLRGGAGLGLSMVYGMVERHEGKVQVESTLGKGTCVRLILPLRPLPPDRSATALLPRSAAQKRRILCIDDEPLLRELLKEVLQSQEHNVETAESGQAGLDAFHAARSRGEPFDLVITDLGMPHVDGRQVAQMVKSECPQTPVIMLTGWGTILKEEGNLPVQVDLVLSKPPNLTELSNAIVKVTERQRSR